MYRRRSDHRRRRHWQRHHRRLCREAYSRGPRDGHRYFPAALAVARANAADHGVADRIDWITGDLLSAVSDRQFDFIVSNPPYVSEAEYAALPTTVRDFEPRQALLAGPYGTEVIERLVPQAAERLAPGGWLLIEISPMIEAAAFKLLAAEPTLEPAPTIKDLSGLARIVQARKRA